ncbi:putative IQ motif, EF-hand binding protein [Rosa chinensis]|uniref:Putative IQ motif, EF-hand binding protein n=1 Tax=Rosa chinensis TaxID=74649 RepID=A0A2P6RAM9_ROSCH|nr:protein IQ-DOMAIN 1 [Rosa chinensis]XP_024188534.1 protein IQ-DOMAIN 1 [Rosa chinensis]PRQ43478.1 putative IQ motif, EF-hand binding protein [Rosa chinensis]
MGRKGNWFSSVKKALSPDSKEKKEQRSDKSKKKWFGKQKQPEYESTSLAPPPTSPPLPPQEEVKLTNVVNEQQNYAYPVAITATATVEPEVPAPPPVQAAPEVVRLPTVNRYAGKSREEAAAIKIQTAFRGYLARRALRALRGLVRLKTLIEGSVVKRQATNTLKCMQTLSRVQAQIRSRRIRMLEENQALQRQLLLKHAKETLQLGDEWDDSLQSKEQVEANLLSKHEAAIRRERALAYAFSHQKNGKSSAKSVNPMFMDPSNPTWGWSWLERWMAARPWESRGMTDKDIHDDHSSVKSVITRSISPGEINKSYARYLLNSDKQSPTASEKPSHPGFHLPSTPSRPASTKVARKLKPSPSPRGSIRTPDDDTKSVASMQSVQFRRHSIAGSSVRDDESMDSSPSLPSYMVPTKSARAKSRLQSPAEKNGITEKDTESVKKRLSFPASPARPRRHSGPPKVDTTLITTERKVSSVEVGS